LKATSSVVEDYLQVLHYLTRDGYPVIAARLVERLNVTPPTVTATLQRMERDGLVAHGPHKEILFTAEGRQVADNIVRRHALAERLLTDDALRDRLVAEASEHVLSFDWADVARQGAGVYSEVAELRPSRRTR